MYQYLRRNWFVKCRLILSKVIQAGLIISPTILAHFVFRVPPESILHHFKPWAVRINGNEMTARYIGRSRSMSTLHFFGQKTPLPKNASLFILFFGSGLSTASPLNVFS